jgi:hypothetical protein
MKHLGIWLGLVVIWLSLCSTGRAAEKKALLCACGDYSNAKLKIFPNLNGPSNDVTLLEELLVSRFGFSKNNITVLGRKNAPPATRGNILRKLNELVQGAKKGDQLVFSFHGHGFQQLNRNPLQDPENGDGLDEILLPADYGTFDPGTGTFHNAIADDDIYEILKQVDRKGAFMTVIADSCHSGTIGRSIRLKLVSVNAGPQVVMRGVPLIQTPRGSVETFPAILAVHDADDLNALRRVLAPQVSEKQFAIKMRALREKFADAQQKGKDKKDPDALAVRGVVTLSAVKPDQTTPEMVFTTPNRDVKWYGAFTYALAHILSSDANLTADQATEKVRQFYKSKRIEDCTPQVDADAAFRIKALFGGMVRGPRLALKPESPNGHGKSSGPAKKSKKSNQPPAPKEKNRPKASSQFNDQKENRVLTAVRNANPNAARYKPRDLTGDGKKETMCNWFVADVSRQLDHGDRAIPTNDQPDPDHPGRHKPQSANRLHEHFHRESKTNGNWRLVDATEAAAAANRGEFVVASTYNAKGPGHIAVVIPGSTANDIRIAQAGRVNGANLAVKQGFGSRTPTYFVYTGR